MIFPLSKSVKPLHHFGIEYTIVKHPSTQFTIEYPKGSKVIRGDKGENLYERLTGPTEDIQAFNRFIEISKLTKPIDVTEE